MAISFTPSAKGAEPSTPVERPGGTRRSNALIAKLVPLVRLLARDAASKTLPQDLTGAPPPEPKVAP
jgi:hypothetical protein